MTRYAKLNDTGEVAEYPLTMERFLRTHNVAPILEQFADGFTLADLRDFGVVPVEETEPPALEEGQTLDEATPAESNGVWSRQWTVHDWLTIEPGGLYARIADEGQTVIYPYSAADLRRDFQIAARPGAIRQMDGQWGVVAVEKTEPPEATAEQLAQVNGIEQTEGVWRQVWSLRDRTPEELTAAKEDLRRAIDQKLQEAFESGFSPASGPLQGHTLQARDVVDRTNWLTSQAAYSAAVAMGLGDEQGATFRTAGNATVTTTYALGLSTLLAMADWGKTIMGNSWALKDAVAAAETFAELAAIDINAGWPA